MSLDYVSNQEIIQAAAPQSAAGCVGLSNRRRESETTMRRNRLGFDCLALRPAGAGGCFKDRHIDDVSRTEAAHSGDDGAHRFAAINHPPEGGVAVAKVALAEFVHMNFVSSSRNRVWKRLPRARTHPDSSALCFAADDWCAEIIGA